MLKIKPWDIFQEYRIYVVIIGSVISLVIEVGHMSPGQMQPGQMSPGRMSQSSVPPASV